MNGLPCCGQRCLNGLCHNDYVWSISDGVNTGLVENEDTITFLGAGGITTLYNSGTHTMTITGGGAGSEWYAQGNNAATIPADVKDGDTVLWASANQNQPGGGPYTNDGVLVSAVSTVVGPPDTHTMTFMLNNSASLIGATFADGLLRWDGTALAQPASNVIVFGPQDSLLTAGQTVLASQLGTMRWEIQSNGGDIDIIDGAGLPFVEFDASGDRLLVCDDTKSFIPALPIHTRQVIATTSGGATSTNALQMICGTAKTSSFINFGDRNNAIKGQFYSYQGASGGVSATDTCSFHLGFIDNTINTPAQSSYIWSLPRAVPAVPNSTMPDRNTVWVSDNYNGNPAVDAQPYYTRFLVGAETFAIQQTQAGPGVGGLNINNSTTGLPLVWDNNTSPPNLSNQLTNLPDFRMPVQQWWLQSSEVVPSYGPVAQFTGFQFGNELMEGVYAIHLNYCFTWRTTNATDPGPIIELSLATGGSPGGGGGPVVQGAQRAYASFQPANSVAIGRTLVCSGSCTFYWGATVMSSGAVSTPQVFQIWYNRYASASNTTAVIRTQNDSTVVYVRRIC